MVKTEVRPPRLEEMPERLTVPEVAGLLRMSKAFVYKMLAEGRLPRAPNTGRYIRIPKSAVERVLRGD